jgi:hypothetical protein
MVDVSIDSPRFTSSGKWIPPEILTRSEKALAKRSATHKLPAADRYDLNVSQLGECSSQRGGVPCNASAGLAFVLAVERNLQQYDLGMSKTKLSE